MLDLFYQFTHFLKIQESVTIDNNVFRLHYKVSSDTPLLEPAIVYIGKIHFRHQWWCWRWPHCLWLPDNTLATQLTAWSRWLGIMLLWRNAYKWRVMMAHCIGDVFKFSQALPPLQGIPGNIMDTYCWIHSTFSIPERWKLLRSTLSAANFTLTNVSSNFPTSMPIIICTTL